MTKIIGKLSELSDGSHAFYCPGCKGPHRLTSGWSFDGNYDRPTFSPSVLVTYDGADVGDDDAPPKRCHSFVRSGRIEFLPDCTHSLAGQTVDLPAYPEKWL